MVNGCRHGDKASEMQLVDFTTYVEAAEKLINENPLGLKRVALVSSEDPYVIHEASRLTRLDSGTLQLPRWGIQEGPGGVALGMSMLTWASSTWGTRHYLGLQSSMRLGCWECCAPLLHASDMPVLSPLCDIAATP